MTTVMGEAEMGLVIHLMNATAEVTKGFKVK